MDLKEIKTVGNRTFFTYGMSVNAGTPIVPKGEKNGVGIYRVYKSSDD
jgi:hypothetical protein